MTTWFTSDLHLGHANVIKHCNRPFTDVDEMDRVLIQNWNDRITDDDEVYVLGDLTLTSRADRVLEDILYRLRGTLYLLKGNHDAWYKKRPGDEEHSSLYYPGVYDEFKDNHKLYVLCHYPFETWNKSHHGSYHLHGHCHGNAQVRGDKPGITGTRRLDVGVDCHDYAPISLEEVNELLL
tara:strand:- start:23135 stop:23674 length:540 start_codon:yes stop_codon:yes gene_type:complete